MLYPLTVLVYHRKQGIGWKYRVVNAGSSQRTQRTQPYCAQSSWWSEAWGSVQSRCARINHYRIYRLPNDKDLDSLKQGSAGRVFDAEELRSLFSAVNRQFLTF